MRVWVSCDLQRVHEVWLDRPMSIEVGAHVVFVPAVAGHSPVLRLDEARAREMGACTIPRGGVHEMEMRLVSVPKGEGG